MCRHTVLRGECNHILESVSHDCPKAMQARQRCPLRKWSFEDIQLDCLCYKCEDELYELYQFNVFEDETDEEAGHEEEDELQPPPRRQPKLERLLLWLSALYMLWLSKVWYWEHASSVDYFNIGHESVPLAC